MNKQQIIRIIKERRNELSSISEESQTAGTLVSRTVRGKKRLYEKTSSGQKYLNSRDADKIRALAANTYQSKLGKVARLEMDQMDSCLKTLEATNRNGFDPADVELVYGSLPDYIRENTHPTPVTDDGYAASWQAEKYTNRWMKKDDRTFITTRGERVRSKSEWIIASMLDKAGVPYRYEETVALNPILKIFAYPDFTVLNKRTRKAYYWEHFGLMDKPDYVETSFLSKMDFYYLNGFLPGDKLLITFESEKSPLDVRHIERIIEQFLL